MIKLNITIDTTDWLEATWMEDYKQLYCESYSGHPEHIAMLRAKASEFGTLLDEFEGLIAQAEQAYIPPTQEELDAELLKQELVKKAEIRKQDMLAGSLYNLNGTDYLISFTKDDGDGMVQVKNGFDLGLTSTNIHFDCGTIFPITKEDFPAFAAWFVNKRNTFF